MVIRIPRKADVDLNGDKMSGNTYPAKDYIKAYLGGKWDANGKTWTVDLDKVQDLIKRGALSVIDSTEPVKQSANGAAKWNGWCNKCHSYCWGDCTAND